MVKWYAANLISDGLPWKDGERRPQTGSLFIPVALGYPLTAHCIPEFFWWMLGSLDLCSAENGLWKTAARVELLAIVRETIRGCSISISELIFLQLKQIGSTLLQTCFLPVAPQSSEPRFLTKEETVSPHHRGRQQRGWLWNLSQNQLMLTLFVAWQLPIPGCSKDCWIFWVFLVAWGACAKVRDAAHIHEGLNRNNCSKYRCNTDFLSFFFLIIFNV